jgi:hypothetical protein
LKKCGFLLDKFLKVWYNGKFGAAATAEAPQNQKPLELITLKGLPRGSGYYDTTKTLWTWFVKP